MPDLAGAPAAVSTSGAAIGPQPPPFDSAVPPGGYHWWYLDAFDPESGQALVVIAFVGSVFSPYYFHARRKSADGLQADPTQHCALNVAVYGAKSKHWAMTERGSRTVERDACQFLLGPSKLRWREDGSLLIEVHERSMPTGKPVVGRITARPVLTTPLALSLDAAGRHQWIPWSPLAKVEVSFDRPAVRWSGEGYMDSNFGSEALEQAFKSWNWSRSRERNGVEIQYHAIGRDQQQTSLALRVDESGHNSTHPAPGSHSIGRTGWGIARHPHCADPLRLVRTLEDTPFYARSLLSIDRPDGPVLAMHESLSLDRFQKTWVRALLPFRMPRRSGG